MSKKENEVAVVNPQLPTFMQQDVDLGTEGLSDFIIPPRAKVVQKQSRDELLEQFAAGDVIIVPQNELIFPVTGSVIVTPIFFFPEWIVVNPLEMKDSLPMIRERTLDKNSQIVAKSRNPDLWEEKCPENEKLSIRYQECLNFVCVIEGNDSLGETPVVFSFSRAEHRQGSTLCSKIRMRKGPIFGGRFRFSIDRRSNAKGQWFGIDIANPTEEEGGPWITDESRYNFYKDLHEQYKQAHEDRRIQVDYDEEEAVKEVGDSTDTAF